MKEEKIKDNLIVKLTFKFALKIIKYCEELEKIKKYQIANQLLKSGTSIGANVWEAQNAESPKDFLHKFKIAGKEVDETQFWILLCKFSQNYPPTEELIKDRRIINRIINKIISTSKKDAEKDDQQIS